MKYLLKVIEKHEGKTECTSFYGGDFNAESHGWQEYAVSNKFVDKYGVSKEEAEKMKKKHEEVFKSDKYRQYECTIVDFD